MAKLTAWWVYMWISDYVGETQFQYSDKRIELANKLLACLPEEHRYMTVNGQTKTQVTRPEVGKLVSPFEAIRSEDIMPVFLRYFDVVQKSESRTVMRFICPVGTRASFTQNETTRALFNVLQQVDQILLDEGVLPPTFGRYLLRKKDKPDL